MTPRFFTMLLRRGLQDTSAGRSVVGDLHEEYDRRPRGWRRDWWYAAAAVRLVVGYAVGVRFRTLVRSPRHGGGGGLRGLGIDVTHAVRSLRRRAGYVGTAGVTLALGIGLTTSIYSVVDTVVIRPLPFADAGQLVTVWNTYPTWRGHEVLDRMWDRVWLAYPEYVDWRDGQDVLSEVAIYGPAAMSLTGRGDPTRLVVGRASSTLFPLLGVRAAHGRLFLPGEEGENAPRLAVLGDEVWRDRFGGDPAVIGGVVTLNGNAYEIIGVLPRRFRLTSTFGGAQGDPIRLWIPVGADGADLDRGNHNYEAIARLARGRTIAQAEAASGPLLRGERTPERQGVRIVSRKSEETRDAKAPVLMLFVAAATLLLVSCASVATLTIGETAKRRGELATRMVLGAGRWRIARQLLAESVLLGVLGAVGGALLAIWGTKALVLNAPASLHLSETIALSWRAAAFGAALGLATGIVFGTAPAVVTGRSGLAFDLRSHGSGARAGGWPVQRAVIAVQFALSVVLLVFAGLAGRTLSSIGAVTPGFRVDDLVVAHLAFPASRYPDGDDLTAVTTAIATSLRSTPGVTAVTGTSALPLGGSGSSSSFTIEGRPVARGEKLPEANRRNVLGEYHAVMDIPILHGRAFTDADRSGAPGVVLVNETMARQFWPNTSPLGRRINRDRRWFEVVGVVGDVRHSSLTSEAQSTFYLHHDQQPVRRFTFVVQSERDVADLTPLMREAIWSVDALLPADDIETMERIHVRSTAEERYRTVLLAAFSGIALLLCSVGIAGVTIRVVALRKRELGIRAAMGAGGPSLIRLVMRQQALAVAIGLAGGAVVAMAAGNAFQRFLYGVTPLDPVTYAGAFTILALVGLGATLVPARHAAAIDPTEALKAE